MLRHKHLLGRKFSAIKGFGEKDFLVLSQAGDKGLGGLGEDGIDRIDEMLFPGVFTSMDAELFREFLQDLGVPLV